MAIAETLNDKENVATGCGITAAATDVASVNLKLQLGLG